jgi:hypothetical protein
LVPDEKTYDQLERHKRDCALALGANIVKSSIYGDVNDKHWVAATKDMLAKGVGNAGMFSQFYGFRREKQA